MSRKRRRPGAGNARPIGTASTRHHAGTPGGYLNWRDDVERAADWALAMGRVVAIRPYGLVVIPDVALLELQGNGVNMPEELDTVLLRDPDTGRTCRLYRVDPDVMTDLTAAAAVLILPPK